MLNERASLMVSRAAAGTKLRQIEQAKEMQKIVDERASRTSVNSPPYEFLEYIGRGSFGRVYKCKHRETQQVVAVKITEVDESDYKAYFEDKDKSLPDLIKEIRVLQQLKMTKASDYVNVIYDAFPMYSELWMVSEYCPGGSITTLMKAAPGGKGLEEKFIIAVARELATALKYVHEANVIHRDIKCGNILITEDGRVQLCDFGVSAIIENDRHNNKRSTIVGTLHWMPPELLEANLSSNYTKHPVAPLYGHEVDIWAFGCTVYEMAMGHGPMATAKTLPELAALAHERPPRLEGDRFSDGLKGLVAFCIAANPVDRPTADAILQHDYLRNTSKTNPTESLRELLERFVLWETSGGSRASLFNPQMGAAAAELPAPQDIEDEWTFSISEDFSDDDLSIDLDDASNTKTPSAGDLNTAFTMPRIRTTERESMVRRGGEGLQRLFDPSDTNPYQYGSNDLALRREYGAEGSNNRETIIDLDDVEPAFSLPTLDLGDVPTLRANRLNREALDRVIAEMKEEDDREALAFQQQSQFTKRATRDWKFPSMGGSEPNTMDTNNRRTQDWTFAGATAEAGGPSRNRFTRDLQAPFLTAPSEDIRNRRTRDFQFPAKDPGDSLDSDMFDLGQLSHNQADSLSHDDFKPTLRHAATQPIGAFDQGYNDRSISAPESPIRGSMIDLDFAMPLEFYPRPATSGSGGETGPFGVEYNNGNPFDLEDQVQLSESNNRLSYHTKSQSEPTKQLPGLLTPNEQQQDPKRGSKYGHSRGASQVTSTAKPPPVANRRHMRRYPRRDASLSRSSVTSASETEPDDDTESGLPSPSRLGTPMLQNDFWSKYNASSQATSSDWNRSLLSRSSSIASRSDMGGFDSDATTADERLYPFGFNVPTLNDSDFSTAPPNKDIRTPAEAFSNGMRPVVRFPTPVGPDPEALKFDADPDLVEREFQRMCMGLINGLQICHRLTVGRDGGSFGGVNGVEQGGRNGSLDAYTDSGMESEGMAI